MTRVKYRNVSRGDKEFSPLYSVLSLLSYMLKAPLVKPGESYLVAATFRTFLIVSLSGSDVVNSLNRQRNALEAFLKACVGLEGNTDLLLETRIW